MMNLFKWFSRSEPEIQVEPPEAHKYPIGPVDLRGWEVFELQPDQQPNSWRYLFKHHEFDDVVFLLTFEHYNEHTATSVPWPGKIAGRDDYWHRVLGDTVEEARENVVNYINVLNRYEALESALQYERERREWKRQREERTQADRERFQAIKAANPHPVSFNLGE